jgi:LysM repeat protein
MKELQQRIRSYQAEMEELRRMISAESSARQKQLGNIADKIQQAGEQSAAQPAPQTEEYDYYVVEAGATLSAISRATGISISRLKKANNMTGDTLRIGQKLKIPRK